MQRLASSNSAQPRSQQRRSGYLYIAVMAIATIIAMIGLSAMSVARNRLKSIQDEHDRHAARIIALSAIENALSDINDNSSWRSNYTNNVEYPGTPTAINGGTMTCKFVDDDGDLGDDTSDSATLYGIGRVGDAVQVYSVTVSPSGSDVLIDQATWSSADAP